MTPHALEHPEYMLGRTKAEHDRLNRQGRLISKITRHFLEEIDLRPGMRVLDVGSGVGDVTLLAARMVAPGGHVVGIDLDESALQRAGHRAAAEKLSNAHFHACDFHDYTSNDLFDAVVGRCVLLHQHDPARALASAARPVRSGGIVAFQEPWFSQAFSFPKLPLLEQVTGWLHRMVEDSGLDGEIGLRLPSLFAAVGLPAPRLSFEMLVDCAPDSEIFPFVADTVRSLLPRLEQLGITTSAQLEIDTLVPRLHQEQAELGSVVGVMPLMGAWCRKS
jgi:2-polyprenyl-3-methyl-5-hydroxy-6-metoxy-1,4-benzoquinol methylase